MTQRELANFLQDILKTISTLERFISGIGFEEFERNEEKIFAVARAIEIIGEAVKNIPDSIRINYPEIPWKAIAGMRDKLIHEYWGTDLQVVWKTTQEDVPQLKLLITRILEDLPNCEK